MLQCHEKGCRNQEMWIHPVEPSTGNQIVGIPLGEGPSFFRLKSSKE